MSTAVPPVIPAPPPDDDPDDSRFRAAIAGIMADIRERGPGHLSDSDALPPVGPAGG